MALFSPTVDDVVAYAQRMSAEHLVKFTSGNISARLAEDSRRIVVTPTSLPYDRMRPDDAVIVDIESGEAQGVRQPTSELPLHLSLYRARPDIGAVVHTHSRGALAFAILQVAVPPLLTTLVAAVGGDVPIAPYTRSGTANAAILRLLEERAAVILPNHGLLAVGSTLRYAYAAAVAVETAAQAYLDARLHGELHELSADEVARIRASSYLPRWPGTPPA